MQRVALTINGETVAASIDERTLLLEFVRDVAGLTGAKGGCFEARCGCCTVLVEGVAVKSCNVLAVQCDGRSVTTVEGLGGGGAANSPAETNGDAPASLVAPPTLGHLQQAFMDNGALQCGFCTPGMLMTLTEFLEREPNPTEEDVRRAISGNLCRCTGYQMIVDAALDASARMRGESGAAVDAAQTTAE